MILKINPAKPNQESINEVISVLKNGGLVVYPTETAYGLGCDAFNTQAINKVFNVKNRPNDQPLPVIVNNLDMIKTIAKTNNDIKLLVNMFHPGPLVIASNKKKIIPDVLNAKGIAFRISSNIIVSKIIDGLKNPLVSTSANLTGDKPPYSLDQVISSLDETKIDLILDAGQLPVRKVSTVIDFLEEPSPQIIRIGEILPEDIFATLEIKEEDWSNHLRLISS
ncbi:MAG: threonylcarbamoyl-AMP synthase [Candidatus Heimdallarchaeota archaeon]